MSGGSYDYFYFKLEEFADRLERYHGAKTSPERKAFAEHIRLIAKAAQAIEWVDSCDYGEGDEIEAIMKCITPSDVLTAAVTDAKFVETRLSEAIRYAEDIIAGRVGKLK